MLDDTLKAADFPFAAIEKVGEKSPIPNPSILETTDNSRVLEALESGEARLAAGTAWLWAREEFEASIDVLFVDEAGQMSLADVLAVSQAAKRIILLGDPQQLEQPLQGTHPPGVASSALQHILGDAETMPPERGRFLAETWRLAPKICDFTSEVFYESRLRPHDGCELQQLTGSRFAGSGLWFIPVEHDGNQNSSDEETAVVASIVQELLQSKVGWIDMKGIERPLTGDDILIVSPYNAQVFNLAGRISNVKIGTVDKFQGQEAPVVIYSMATSSPEDAPRGMEFLYSINRFNVATSRARCACILVGNPRLFEPDCQTPRQMKLANVLCRYLELAKCESLRS
jgi:superfamily I DNA and/or RNA helicase